MNKHKVGGDKIADLIYKFDEVNAVVRFIHEQRGTMPVDDLMDNITWRLEKITGILPDDDWL